MQICHAGHTSPGFCLLPSSCSTLLALKPNSHLGRPQIPETGSSLVCLVFKGNIPNCTQVHMNTRERAGPRSTRSHLSWCTHGPVQRRPFLCFAEVGVLGVATPQLLAGIKSTELKHKKDQSGQCFERTPTGNCNRSCSTVGFFLS